MDWHLSQHCLLLHSPNESHEKNIAPHKSGSPSHHVHMRLRSFRARSTSITCSAFSFLSFNNFSARFFIGSIISCSSESACNRMHDRTDYFLRSTGFPGCCQISGNHHNQNKKDKGLDLYFAMPDNIKFIAGKFLLKFSA